MNWMIATHKGKGVVERVMGYHAEDLGERVDLNLAVYK